MSLLTDYTPVFVRPHSQTHQTRGFSLVELAVTVAVIGILAAIGIMTFLGNRAASHNAEAISDLYNSVSAARAYHADIYAPPEFPFEWDQVNDPAGDLTGEQMRVVLEEREPAIPYTTASVEPGDRDVSVWVDPEGVHPLSPKGTLYLTRASRSGVAYVVRVKANPTTGWLIAEDTEAPVAYGGTYDFYWSLYHDENGDPVVEDPFADSPNGASKRAAGSSPTETTTPDTTPDTTLPGEPEDEYPLPVPEGLEIIFDDFNRADGQLGSTSGGNIPWEVLSGDVVVNSNKFHVNTAGFAVVETGSADGELTVDLPINASRAIYLRVVDADNWLRLVIENPYHPRVRLDQSVDGHVTPVGGTLSVAYHADTGFRVWMFGNKIMVFSKENAATPAYTWTTSTHQTATKHGLGATGTGLAGDNFQFIPDALGAPASPLVPYARDTIGQVELVWTSSPTHNVHHYEVERDGNVIATVAATTTVYLDTDVQAGNTYTYGVVAVDMYGNRSAPAQVNVLVLSDDLVAIHDDFDRENGELGTTSDGKSTWQVMAGTASIFNGQFRVDGVTTLPVTSSGTTNSGFAVVETGSSDGVLTMTPPPVSGNPRLAYQGAVYLRVVDADNWLRIVATNSNDIVSLRLEEAVNGQVTYKQTTTVDRDHGGPFRVWMFGDQISVFKNASAINPSYTWTTSTHQTATKHGLGSMNGNRIIAEDFTFTPDAVGAPEPARGLHATSVTQPVTLVWTASPSPDVARYEVHRGGDLIGTVDAQTTSFQDNGTSNGQTYTYQVMAVDAYDNRSEAATTTVLVQTANPTQIEDNFDNRGNGPLGITSDGKASWQVMAGTASIFNGQFRVDGVTTLPVTSSGTTNSGFAVVETGSSDGVLTMTPPPVSNPRLAYQSAVYLRVVDADNWLRIVATNLSSSVSLRLDEAVNGQVTYKQTTTVDRDHGGPFRVWMFGDQISVFKNASAINPSYTWTTSTHQTATKHGLGAMNGNLNIAEDFTFTPAG